VLDDATIAARAVVPDDLRLTVTLDGAALNSAAAVGNDARLALTLDDVGIAARATTQAERLVTLNVVLDDASVNATATVADTPAVTPAVGGSGGGRRRGRSTSAVSSFAPPRLSPLQIEPVKLNPRAARVSVTLDNATAVSKAATLTAVRGGVGLADARLTARAKVVPFIPGDATLRARATADWSGVIADDDDILEILAA
jgi:hypothetical protein